MELLLPTSITQGPNPHAVAFAPAPSEVSTDFRAQPWHVRALSRLENDSLCLPTLAAKAIPERYI